MKKIVTTVFVLAISTHAHAASNSEKLINAIDNSNINKVSSLIRYGIDPNKAASLYNTKPLMHAVASGSVKLVNKLINNGSRVDVKDNFGNTPLIQSIKINKPVIAKVLLKHSRNVNSKDRKGSSALHLAAKQGNEPLFREILKRGGHLNAVDHLGNNVLFYAIAGQNKQIINNLIDMQYFDLSHRNQYGEKAVHVAQRYGLPKIAKLLIKGRNSRY